MSIKDQYLANKCQEIESLINDSKKWAETNAKLGAHLATYINVVILGILEDCIEYLVKARARATGDTGIENYISKDIKESFKNPNYGSICSLLSKFNDTYSAKFQRKFNKGCLEYEALDGLIINKTNVAHYGLANLKLSLDDVDNYFKGVVNVLEEIEDLLVTNR